MDYPKRLALAKKGADQVRESIRLVGDWNQEVVEAVILHVIERALTAKEGRDG